MQLSSINCCNCGTSIVLETTGILSYNFCDWTDVAMTLLYVHTIGRMDSSSKQNKDFDPQLLSLHLISLPRRTHTHTHPIPLSYLP